MPTNPEIASLSTWLADQDAEIKGRSAEWFTEVLTAFAASSTNQRLVIYNADHSPKCGVEVRGGKVVKFDHAAAAVESSAPSAVSFASPVSPES